MSGNDWKKRLGTVYSTNPNYAYKHDAESEPDTLPPAAQKLIVYTDSRLRKGKTVTIVQGFTGKSEDLEALGKLLKTKCGVGGSAKDGEIILQGDFKLKAAELLKQAGYNVKLK